MNRDDIIRMAREANIGTYINLESYLVGSHLERFAELVAAAEREACAQIAHNTYEGFGAEAQGVDFVKQQIIRQIRERGQSEVS
jgi:hypothetical protein